MITIFIFRNEGRETRSEYDRKVDKVKEEWQTEVKTLKKQHEDELKKVKVSFVISASDNVNKLSVLFTVFKMMFILLELVFGSALPPV